uniref:Uncharacterized protein n=1 Tax=Physcomitrium patens TaxID=3218 RepID=A0A2K1L7S8_PHYPA|nr:hypothetical protein PHYPA_000507 [Physcomitrium patens]
MHPFLVDICKYEVKNGNDCEARVLLDMFPVGVMTRRSDLCSPETHECAERSTDSTRSRFKALKILRVVTSASVFHSDQVSVPERGCAQG